MNTIAAIGGGFTFLMSMGLVHTFLDAVPSTFLGVPDEGTALSILPAHRMVIEGRGMEVIRIALRASIMAVMFSFLLYIPYTWLAPLYKPVYGRVAIIVLMALMVMWSRNAPASLLVIILSGTLGVVVLRRIPLDQPFFHLFTGLFGVPILIGSMMSPGKTWDDQGTERNIHMKELTIGSIKGTFLGMLASLLPAFTASQAAVIGTITERDDRSFLTLVYSINTVNFLFGVFNYRITGKIRNGVVAAMGWTPPVWKMALVGIVASLLVMLYGEYVGRMFLRVTGKIGQRTLSVGVVTFLVLLSVYFDGLTGATILMVSTLVGFLPGTFGIRRTACMGVLMIPTLLNGI